MTFVYSAKKKKNAKNACEGNNNKSDNNNKRNRVSVTKKENSEPLCKKRRVSNNNVLSNLAPVSEWNTQTVFQWFCNISIEIGAVDYVINGNLKAQFDETGLNEIELKRLTLGDLREEEYGIVNIGHRKDILEENKKLK